MNVTSGGPHILLFERDQQLTTLLSSELALAGYEVHTARTAVEVFDAIARFPVRLVMVDLAQAQAGRREFWVALDAQRRGRGVQVFTFRCSNLAGYGPDDPDERVQTVLTDLEVDGMMGVVKLVDAVRTRVPGTLTHSSLPATRSAVASRPQEVDIDPSPSLGTRSAIAQHAREMNQMQERMPFEVTQAPPAVPAVSSIPSAPVSSAVPAYQPSMAAAPTNPTLASVPQQQQQQASQGAPRPQLPQDMPTLVPQTRAPETSRSAPSTFTDKIRAVIYPSSRNFSPIPETNRAARNSNAVVQQSSSQYQNSDVSTRSQANQRLAETDYQSHGNQEEVVYQQPANSSVSGSTSYPNYNGVPAGSRMSKEESGLDQLSRMLRENRFALQNPAVHGNMQQHALPSSSPTSALSIDQHEIQEFQEQVVQAARLDEAHGRSSGTNSRLAEPSSMNVQLRPSPIQGIPYERESNSRGGSGSSYASQLSENTVRSAAVVLPSNQAMPSMQASQPEPGQIPSTEVPRARPATSEVPVQMYQASPARSYSPQLGQVGSPQPYQVSPARSYSSQSEQAEVAQPHQASSAQSSYASQLEQEDAPQIYQQGPAARQYSSQTVQANPSQLYQNSPVQQYPSQSNQSISVRDQGSSADERAFTNPRMRATPQMRETTSETSYPASVNTQVISVQELAARSAEQEKHEEDLLHSSNNDSLADQVQASLQQTMARRPEIRTSDDTLLDIVKSLPPMAPAPQPPQVQVLHGRATRSLGSVLLEGHLVPQERLQVAQHVQRMLRGVDLNYQLGEILLMFKLLTPDQLLAASLVSYGMISTVQIGALGRIRQELHAMGLEYDLESLLVLFRILTPEQMREVRASWSS